MIKLTHNGGTIMNGKLNRTQLLNMTAHSALKVLPDNTAISLNFKASELFCNASNLMADAFAASRKINLKEIEKLQSDEDKVFIDALVTNIKDWIPKTTNQV